MQAGKDGIWYAPFPVLGMATDGKQVMLSCGGGGSKASKEVPNLVRVDQYDETACTFTELTSLNSGKRLIVCLSYSVFNGLWLAGVVDGSCMILELSESADSLQTVCEWVCETEEIPSRRGPIPPSLNQVKFSPNGDIIASGGSDGFVRLWKANGKEAPSLHVSCAKAQAKNEIKDLDFSPDGKLVASCDDTGKCHLYNTSTGQEDKVLSAEEPICRARFFINSNNQPAIATVVQSVRGPSHLVLYSMDGTVIKKVKIDKNPVLALAVHPSSSMVAVAVGEGPKRIYSLPTLKVLKQKPSVHDMPANLLEFMGQDSAISASGDRVFHVLRAKGSAKSGGGSVVFMMFVLVVLMAVMYVLLRIGMKGGVLQQGQ
jgi:WD40 repeat protein